MKGSALQRKSADIVTVTSHRPVLANCNKSGRILLVALKAMAKNSFADLSNGKIREGQLSIGESFLSTKFVNI